MAGAFKRTHADGSASWYVGFKDERGLWRQQKTTARSERDAKKLAHELEAQAERERLKLDKSPGTFRGSFGELCLWAYGVHFSLLRGREHDRVGLQRHGVDSRLGQLAAREVTAVELAQYFSELERHATVRGEPMAATSINRLRARFSVVFNVAREHGLLAFDGDNPALQTRSRAVVRKIRGTLTLAEIPRVLDALEEYWRGVFATCLFAGLRKGEVFALQKRDVDLDQRRLIVQRSHENDLTKGGHADAVPIHEALVPYLEAAFESPGPFLFPDHKGERRSRQHKLPPILRRALINAGLVEGYDHVCRRKLPAPEGAPVRCGHVEHHPDATPRRCPKCQMKLWPVGIPREIRFHDTRHTFATLALESGASLAAVQKILRHKDPRLTTETYGHLATQHLQSEVNRIQFETPGQALVTGGMLDHGPDGGPDGPNEMAEAMVEPSPPTSPAGGSGVDVGRGDSESGRGAVSPKLRGSEKVSGGKVIPMRKADKTGVETAGIEPATYALRKWAVGDPDSARDSQVAVNTDIESGPLSRDSLQNGTLETASVSPKLRAPGTHGYASQDAGDVRAGAYGQAVARSAAPGHERVARPGDPAKAAGLERQLSVAEVAELLSVSREWVRKRIERNELGHVRLGAHTRVPESELKRFLAKGQQ